MMFVTDFDGTLYQDNHTVSSMDFETLEKLGKLNIKRVIATGRSFYSALKVIPKEFPIDYLIFSSGAGILEWKDKKIIKSYSLNKIQIEQTVKILKENRCDFMLHKKIPDNHHFYYYKSSLNSNDFDKRCSIYSSYCEKWNDSKIADMEEACQFVVIIPSEDLSAHAGIYDELKYKLKKTEGLHIIRATSPTDKKSLWIEIFPEGVSKAHGIKTIADLSSVNYNCIAALGNDFNDLDMLKWVKNAFVVGNAPDELKNEFITVKSNNENGFSDAANKFLEMKNISGAGR